MAELPGEEFYTRNIQLRPKFIIFLLALIIVAFFSGLLARDLLNFKLSLTGSKTLSLETNPPLLPKDDGLLRSHSALVEGQIKKISENQITLAAGKDEIKVKLSEQLAKSGSPELSRVSTDSSGLRVPPKRVLPDFKEGDIVRVILEVIGEETLVTNISVIK